VNAVMNFVFPHGVNDTLTKLETTSFSRRTLLHGVNMNAVFIIGVASIT